LADSSPPDPLQLIAGALTAKFGVTECADVNTLLTRDQKSGAGFVVDKRLRVGNYYDLQPALTVYDPVLGTLAFVEAVSRGEDPAQAWRAIERATAVRQILLDDADRQSGEADRTLALHVELVLVVSGSLAPTTPDPLRTTLTSVARQTGYLRLIGVSVLDVEQHPQLPEPVLRRAFAWLLRGTDAWFKHSRFAAPDAARWRPHGDSFELQLQDYRMPGRRRLRCDGKAWLNVVHGHNGSGKSSLAEAVEVLLTERVQRLDDARETNYFRVLRHRPTGVHDKDLEKLTPAEVTVLGTDGLPKSTVRISHQRPPVREGSAPSSKYRANSFRIDQVFMDKLIRSKPGERAAIFLDAFAPQDQKLLKDLQQLRAQLRAAWPDLPEHVRRKAELLVATTKQADPARPLATSSLSEDEMAEFIVRELGALEGILPGTNVAPTKAGEPATPPDPAKAIESLLPGDKNEMARLGQLLPSINDSVKKVLDAVDGQALSSAMTEFQSTLVPLFPLLSGHVDDLKTSLRIFNEFRTWTAGERIVGGNFEADLRRWLDLQALVDLATKYGDVVATVERALQRQWEPDARERELFTIDGIAPGLARQLESRKIELTDQLNLARARVESPKESDDAPAEPRRTGRRERLRRWLSVTEVDALNRVGQYLVSAAGPEPLGVRFNRALAADREEKLADGTIGRSMGLDAVIEEAAELVHVCELLQAFSARAGAGGSGVAEKFGAMVQSARELKSLSTELPKSFFYRLTQGNREDLKELIAAFNELLALISPARWAYRDIEISPEVNNGDPSLGLEIGEGAPAALLFNTAELNASALVLFLLLAPQLPNDLRLLILDDPLQNMDELTVVTLGRALAKLRIVYPQDWMILAFFHGEENIQRIRHEAPCHVYHLPWLQSSESGEGDKPIESVTGENTWPAEWQRLSADLLADPVVARSAQQATV
jgi:AAA domain-containing protein